MVDGDALEMRFGETQRGFKSPPLRFKNIAEKDDHAIAVLRVEVYICTPLLTDI